MAETVFSSAVGGWVDCRNTLLVLRVLAQDEPPPKELPSVVSGPDFDEEVPF